MGAMELYFLTYQYSTMNQNSSFNQNKVDSGVVRMRENGRHVFINGPEII